WGEVNVAATNGRADGEREAAVQEVDITMEEMPRRLIALVNQRIMTVDHFHFAVAFGQRSNVRIVPPEFRAGRADVGDELPRIRAMEIAHGDGQHDDIARRLETPKDQLTH